MFRGALRRGVNNGWRIVCRTCVLPPFRTTGAYAGNWLAKRRGAFTAPRHLDSSAMVHQAFTTDATRDAFLKNGLLHAECNEAPRERIYERFNVRTAHVKPHWVELLFNEIVPFTIILRYRRTSLHNIGCTKGVSHASVLCARSNSLVRPINHDCIAPAASTTRRELAQCQRSGGA